ncbi:MAG: FHA domain-containing serine/threonine-protein kinase [Anaerolineae bacterium]
MENLTGRTLGGYELQELIGAGGMASIYKGFDKKLSRWVAVKVMSIISMGGSEKVLLARFRQEAQAIASLRHRNILTIFDYGEEEAEGWAYIVMEHVAGGSLKDRIIPGQPFEWSRALNVIIPVSQALAFAHSQGVIHRDIKPANILMTQDDWPLLADFGLAKMKNSSAPNLTMPGQVLGTMAYAAPEQIQESLVIDARADIYSLGIVLYELLTTKLPFQGQTTFDFLMARLTDPPIPLLTANPDAPTEFVPVMDKALAQEPANRYQSMNDFTEALREVRYDLSGSRITLQEKPKSRLKKIEEKTSVIDTEELHRSLEVTVRLKITASGQEIAPLAAGRSELIIGRAHKEVAPDIDLAPYGGGQAGVSRRHGRLVRQGDEWLVEDLGSINGTFLNGAKVEPNQLKKLKNGDIIRCGQVELQFMLADGAK